MGCNIKASQIATNSLARFLGTMFAYGFLYFVLEGVSRKAFPHHIQLRKLLELRTAARFPLYLMFGDFSQQRIVWGNDGCISPTSGTICIRCICARVQVPLTLWIIHVSEARTYLLPCLIQTRSQLFSFGMRLWCQHFRPVQMKSCIGLSPLLVLLFLARRSRKSNFTLSAID